MCMYLCVPRCTHVHLCVCVCMWRPEPEDRCFLLSPSYFMRLGIFLNLELIDLAGLAHQEGPGTFPLLPPMCWNHWTVCHHNPCEKLSPAVQFSAPRYSSSINGKSNKCKTKNYPLAQQWMKKMFKQLNCWPTFSTYTWGIGWLELRSCFLEAFQVSQISASQ